MAALADAIPQLRCDLEAVADAERARPMAAYLQDRFAFLGIPAPERRRIAKSFILAGNGADASELLGACEQLWAQPEREFQHIGVDLLRRWEARLGEGDLVRVEPLLRSKSWWDTIDAFAAHVVGGVVARHPALVATMERWIDDPDIWIARTAILHQLRYGERTDAERLFDFVDRRCDDTEFFIRKACGWALRQYARHDPDAVRAFVGERADRLSSLTIREATKHL